MTAYVTLPLKHDADSQCYSLSYRYLSQSNEDSAYSDGEPRIPFEEYLKVFYEETSKYSEFYWNLQLNPYLPDAGCQFLVTNFLNTLREDLKLFSSLDLNAKKMRQSILLQQQYNIFGIYFDIFRLTSHVHLQGRISWLFHKLGKLRFK